MKMLTEIGEVENAEPYIRAKLEKKEKIMGFGHVCISMVIRARSI